jgi:hypothetical protein
MNTHRYWIVVLGLSACPLAAQAQPTWRSLPLIENGAVAKGWRHIGWGGFVVDGDSLRTEVDEKGMGLLLYEKEKLGNCRIRVVFKCKDAKANAGVFVRIDDGILAKAKDKPAPAQRSKDGKLSPDMLKKFMQASEEALGPWYAVHHGYEVQICDAADEYHRTGAIYSLAKAAAPPKRPEDWRTMVITLRGNLVLVDIEGTRVTTFDPKSKQVPAARKWFEPRREPVRPHAGYIGLQNHDPGDIVHFKEVSVRPLDDGPDS